MRSFFAARLIVLLLAAAVSFVWYDRMASLSMAPESSCTGTLSTSS